jgi:hypothetical protein
VLGGWAAAHPLDALAWAADTGVTILESSSIEDFGDGYVSSRRDLISTALKSDRDRTIEWIRSQPASPERDSMLVEALSWTPLAETLEGLAELSPESRKERTWWIIRKFQNDLEGAEKWVRGLTESERIAGIRELSYVQAENFPERIDSLAEAWSAGPERETALEGIAQYLCQNRPEQAAEFARQISDPTARWKIYQSLASFWLYRDEAAARKWISSTTELSPDDKRVVVREFEER